MLWRLCICMNFASVKFLFQAKLFYIHNFQRCRVEDQLWTKGKVDCHTHTCFCHSRHDLKSENHSSATLNQKTTHTHSHSDNSHRAWGSAQHRADTTAQPEVTSHSCLCSSSSSLGNFHKQPNIQTWALPSVSFSVTFTGFTVGIA